MRDWKRFSSSTAAPKYKYYRELAELEMIIRELNGKTPVIGEGTFVAENAALIGDVTTGRDCSIWYGAVLRGDVGPIRLGNNVNIQDCENVSRKLSDRLDEEDFIEEAYILEVSSPGLGRALKKDRHLEKSLGEAVEIRLYRPQEKRKEFEGILKAYDGDSITIEAQDGEKKFARPDIALIRLALDF